VKESLAQDNKEQTNQIIIGLLETLSLLNPDYNSLRGLETSGGKTAGAIAGILVACQGRYSGRCIKGPPCH